MESQVHYSFVQAHGEFAQGWPTFRCWVSTCIAVPGMDERSTLTACSLALVESGQRLTRQPRLVGGCTCTRRSRPRNVERAEVFVAFTAAGTPAPADASAFRSVWSVSDGFTVVSYESPQGGMQAHHLARWVTRRGAMGPWSDTSSATVAA